MIVAAPQRIDEARYLPVLQASLASASGPAKRIDTHMSHLLIGDSQVIKLVRAVRHTFADMSTLARRKAACEAEFAINKQVAPALYDAVLPVIHTDDGSYRLGGRGRIVDYAICMRRFVDGCLFSELVDTGHLTVSLVDQAVAVLAEFHERQPPQRSTRMSKPFDLIIEDLRQTTDRALINDMEHRHQAEHLFDTLEQTAADSVPLLEMRLEAGFVRRGHGDFHLGNICVHEGRVTPFDALAFDETLATTDILYDLAFLLMDLHRKGAYDLATQAMNGYFDRLRQDEPALALLPFFMSMRAAIRMAVAMERREVMEAESYRRLAEHLLEPQSPCLVAVGGLSGSGKTVVSRAIAHLLPGACGARVLATDRLRKRNAGIPLGRMMPAHAYTKEAKSGVYKELADRAAEALDTGTSLVADATYVSAVDRRAIMEVAGERLFIGIWLVAEQHHRLERVAARYDDASDATTAVAAAQIEPKHLEHPWQKIDANGTIDETIALATKVLDQARRAQ